MTKCRRGQTIHDIDDTEEYDKGILRNAFRCSFVRMRSR